MNASVQGKRQYVSASWVSRGTMGLIIFFVAAILVSAFSTIYFKDLNRRLFFQYQTLSAQQQAYQVQNSQLLLEQSTWSTQARIQSLAQNTLNMVVPQSKKIVMVSVAANDVKHEPAPQGPVLADNN